MSSSCPHVLILILTRSLSFVKTLGCTRVICSDKTGTLTTNMMFVCKMFTFADEAGNLEEFEISGSTYEPMGDIFKHGKKVAGKDFTAFEEIATILVMFNDSAINFNDFKNIFKKVGEATETALMTLAEKINPYDIKKSGKRLEFAKLGKKDLDTKWNKDFTLEFSRDRKSMSSFCTPPRRPPGSARGPRCLSRAPPRACWRGASTSGWASRRCR